jgi:hypothetical protein
MFEYGKILVISEPNVTLMVAFYNHYITLTELLALMNERSHSILPL